MLIYANVSKFAVNCPEQLCYMLNNVHRPAWYSCLHMCQCWMVNTSTSEAVHSRSNNSFMFFFDSSVNAFQQCLSITEHHVVLCTLIMPWYFDVSSVNLQQKTIPENATHVKGNEQPRYLYISKGSGSPQALEPCVPSEGGKLQVESTRSFPFVP